VADTTDSSTHPISTLRRLLDEAPDEAAAERFCHMLDGDGRVGARALAERWRKQREARERERRRLDRLFELRGALRDGGARHIAGVDEVGVGPLAGPVVAAAVVLPDVVDLPGLDDSKKLSAKRREELATQIREQAVAIGIGEVPPEEIDRLNIHRASLEAMRRAVQAAHALCPLDHLLIDARIVPGAPVPAHRQTSLVRGDSRDGSIAAASIVAKVHRDAIMLALERAHPGYGFARHMGYGTAEHLDALQRLGATPIHRRSFAPVAAVVTGR
jgi:ribonuclease HII